MPLLRRLRRLRRRGRHPRLRLAPALAATTEALLNAAEARNAAAAELHALATHATTGKP